MAEQDTKNEFSKEVLAPPQGIRDDLVSTAVKFLQNPKVTQSPLSQKKAFLQRKGLTDEEIEAAIQRSGATESSNVTSSGGTSMAVNSGLTDEEIEAAIQRSGVTESSNVPSSGGTSMAVNNGLTDEEIEAAIQRSGVTDSSNVPSSGGTSMPVNTGLTDEEIEAAIQRSGITESSNVPSSGGTSMPVNNGGQTLAMAPAIPPKGQEVVYSKWMRARDMIAVISVVTGMSYAAYRLYKELIRPMLFGIPSTDQRLQTLEKNMSESMEKISQTLSSIEQMLSKQEEKLQILSHDVNSKTTGSVLDAAQKETSVSELKSELTSLKGLLLNRRQFPPVPTSVPALPSWQLTHEAGDNQNSNEKGKDEDGSRSLSPKISLSPTPSPVSAMGEPDSGSVVTENQSIGPSGDQSAQDISDSAQTGSNSNLLSEKSDDLDMSSGGVDEDKIEVKGLSIDNIDVANGLPGKTDDLNKDDDGAESNESLD